MEGLSSALGSFVGESPGVFLGLLALFGTCAWLTGKALAETWRPAWQMAPAAIGLAAGERFLDYSLFGGDLFGSAAWMGHVAILLALGLVARRLVLARQMVRQYPWLYRRSGLFSWEGIPAGEPAP